MPRMINNVQSSFFLPVSRVARVCPQDINSPNALQIKTIQIVQTFLHESM